MPGKLKTYGEEFRVDSVHIRTFINLVMEFCLCSVVRIIFVLWLILYTQSNSALDVDFGNWRGCAYINTTCNIVFACLLHLAFGFWDISACVCLKI